MNKHDIEELQAFLQGNYISEAPSQLINMDLINNPKKLIIDLPKAGRSSFNKKNKVDKFVQKSINLLKKKVDDKIKNVGSTGDSITLDNIEESLDIEISDDVKKFLTSLSKYSNDFNRDLVGSVFVNFINRWSKIWVYPKWSNSEKFHGKSFTKKFIQDLQNEVHIKNKECLNLINQTGGVKNLIPFGGLCLGFRSLEHFVFYVHTTTGLIFANMKNVICGDYHFENDYVPIASIDTIDMINDLFNNGTYRLKIDEIMRHKDLGIYGFDDYEDAIEFNKIDIDANYDGITLSTLETWWTIVQCEEYDCSPTTWRFDELGEKWFNFIKPHIDSSTIEALIKPNIKSYEWAEIFGKIFTYNISMTLFDGYDDKNYWGLMTMDYHKKGKFLVYFHNDHDHCSWTWQSNKNDISDKPGKMNTESYIDETIERFNAFMEEFNMTRGDDNYER